MKSKIFFRADGNAQIGLGHVIRSLALAAMLKEKFDIVFLIRNPDKKVNSEIQQYTDQIIALPETDSYTDEANFIKEQGYVKPDDIIVLDGYQFTTLYQEILRNMGCKIVSIDDLHSTYFMSDLVVNHAGGVRPENYHSGAYTQYAIGPKYVLLREAFFKEYPSTKANTTFVCLGGADPDNRTLEVLKVLAEKKLTAKIDLVLGSQNLHRQRLEKYINESNLLVNIHENLGAAAMAELMANSKYGITSASGIAYEYAAISGGLFVIQTVGNQKRIFDHLITNGLAEKFENVDKSVNLHTLIDQQKKLFDGKSPERFVKLFEELKTEFVLKIRKANYQDLKQYFNWANDPDTRQASYNTDPISLDAHSEWYEKKLKDQGTFLYVLSDEKYDFGQIRFDIKQGEAIISYSLDKRFRGKGYGTLLLKLGIEQFCTDHQGGEPIVGFVKKDNVASNKSFQKFRFVMDEKALAGSYKYILKR